MIGRSLSRLLQAEGHNVIPLVRKAQEGVVFWDPAHPEATRLEDFEHFDAVIHLAGENIAGRWSKAKKERLVESRCRDTASLTQIITRLKAPPKIVICASAVGFYGNRGDEVLTEQSVKGEGFLSDLCAQWEAATEALEPRIRVVHMRFGPVLSLEGGPLKRMLPIFRLGLGGKIGTGRQYFSWVAVEDAAGAILHALQTSTLSGPVNVVAPHAVIQGVFAKQLAQQLRRPAFFHLPAWFLRLCLGEMADELLLASAHAAPQRLLETGYEFLHPELRQYLKQLF